MPTKLRFAVAFPLPVSTEKQAKVGESLNVQRKQMTASIKRLGGTIAKEYGGQEHATPGWEKQQVNQLLDDAQKGLFDAVMIAHEDRWSRDNE